MWWWCSIAGRGRSWKGALPLSEIRKGLRDDEEGRKRTIKPSPCKTNLFLPLLFQRRRKSGAHCHQPPPPPTASPIFREKKVCVEMPFLPTQIWGEKRGGGPGCIAGQIVLLGCGGGGGGGIAGWERIGRDSHRWGNSCQSPL